VSIWRRIVDGTRTLRERGSAPRVQFA